MRGIVLITFIFLITINSYAFEPPYSLDTSHYKNNFEKPKQSKFSKKRYGTYTVMGEGGYLWGYYKGMRYTFNFDCILQSTENSAFSARLGIGYSEAVNDSTVKGSNIFFPLSIHILWGIKNSFDMGAGIYYYKNREVFTPFLFLGFRHQKPKGGFMYRAGADIHLERVRNMNGKDLQKTAVFGPLVGIGWTF